MQQAFLVSEMAESCMSEMMQEDNCMGSRSRGWGGKGGKCVGREVGTVVVETQHTCWCVHVCVFLQCMHLKHKMGN